MKDCDVVSIITYICQEKTEVYQNFVENVICSSDRDSKYHRVKFMKGFHIITFLTILTIIKAIILTNLILSVV